jgi:hypothetical protein
VGWTLGSQGWGPAIWGVNSIPVLLSSQRVVSITQNQVPFRVGEDHERDRRVRHSPARTRKPEPAALSETYEGLAELLGPPPALLRRLISELGFPSREDGRLRGEDAEILAFDRDEARATEEEELSRFVCTHPLSQILDDEHTRRELAARLGAEPFAVCRVGRSQAPARSARLP